MFYTITHRTIFKYASAISESVMELRMHPRSEGTQRCLEFKVSTEPRAHVRSFRDYLGNMVDHFDIPGAHDQLTITAESLVELQDMPALPEAISPADWQAIDAVTSNEDHWEMLGPSRFAKPSALLHAFAAEIGLERRADPLTVLRELNTTINQAFTYTPKSTRVDSPIDDALESRRGVCQDYSHIMITLVRSLGIPCRYVSGYLFHRRGDAAEASGDATHAWVEALLPTHGWIGFDPTNNRIAGERHIRVAVGRDYADVPPTRGVYKGKTGTELSVAVRVTPSERPTDLPPAPPELPITDWEDGSAMQMQQQQ